MKLTKRDLQANRVQLAATLTAEGRALARSGVKQPEDIKSAKKYTDTEADLEVRETAAHRAQGVTGLGVDKVATQYLESIDDYRKLIADPVLTAVLKKSGDAPLLTDQHFNAIIALLGDRIGPADVKILAALRPQLTADQVKGTWRPALERAQVLDSADAKAEGRKVAVSTISLGVAGGAASIIKTVLAVGFGLATAGTAPIIMTAAVLGKKGATYFADRGQEHRAALGVARLEGVDVENDLGRIRQRLDGWKGLEGPALTERVKIDTDLIREVLSLRKSSGLAAVDENGRDVAQDLAALVAIDPKNADQIQSAAAAFTERFTQTELDAMPSVAARNDVALPAPEALAYAHNLVGLANENGIAYRLVVDLLDTKGPLTETQVEALKVAFGPELSLREYVAIMPFVDRGLDIVGTWPDATRFNGAKTFEEAVNAIDDGSHVSLKEKSAHEISDKGDFVALAVALGLMLTPIGVIGGGIALLGGMLGKEGVSLALASQATKAFLVDGVDANDSPVTRREASVLFDRFAHKDWSTFESTDALGKELTAQAAVARTLLEAAGSDDAVKNDSLGHLNNSLWEFSEALDQIAKDGGSVEAMRGKIASATAGLLTPLCGQALADITLRDAASDERSPMTLQAFTIAAAFFQKIKDGAPAADLKDAAKTLVAAHEALPKKVRKEVLGDEVALAKSLVKGEALPDAASLEDKFGAPKDYGQRFATAWDDAARITPDRAKEIASQVVDAWWSAILPTMGAVPAGEDAPAVRIADDGVKETRSTAQVALGGTSPVDYDVTGEVRGTRNFVFMRSQNAGSDLQMHVSGAGEVDPDKLQLNLGPQLLARIAGHAVSSQLERQGSAYVDVYSSKPSDAAAAEALQKKHPVEDLATSAFDVNTSHGDFRILVASPGFPVLSSLEKV